MYHFAVNTIYTSATCHMHMYVWSVRRCRASRTLSVNHFFLQKMSKIRFSFLCSKIAKNFGKWQFINFPNCHRADMYILLLFVWWFGWFLPFYTVFAGFIVFLVFKLRWRTTNPLSSIYSTTTTFSPDPSCRVTCACVCRNSCVRGLVTFRTLQHPLPFRTVIIYCCCCYDTFPRVFVRKMSKIAKLKIAT